VRRTAICCRAVTVWLAADPAHLPDDARRAWTEACAANVPIEAIHAPVSVPATVTAIVDGLFGIGLTRPLTGLHAALVDTMNATGLPVYALDIPSGLNSDTGQPPAPESPVVHARHAHLPGHQAGALHRRRPRRHWGPRPGRPAGRPARL
jgi:NAD(P)H-hydrate repair Nnr-like enzyme with NAD(P)H-hydrate epimerase domain